MKVNCKRVVRVVLLALGAALAGPAAVGAASSTPQKTTAGDHALASPNLIQQLSTPITYTTHGTVSVEGKSIGYKAVVGTLVLDGTGADEAVPQVAMSYVAYFRDRSRKPDRPVTFLYNGGPGSSSLWLHIGAWGPKRVVLGDHAYNSPPFKLVNNDYSILDVTDLVFIDMPDTGFGRLLVQGADARARAKSRRELTDEFWGVDQDATAFARFISQFLTKYDLWDAPKYLYGESYGTSRSAVLANLLEQDYNVGLNGVMLQSQILNFSLSIDGPAANPGSDMPYVLALPTYAATAWYHRRLPKYNDEGLGQVLDKAIKFATGDYQRALTAGLALSESDLQQVAERMHDFTGLPVSYLHSANLRVDGGMFEHELLKGNDTSTGRFDTRYLGPSMDPLAKGSEYDPQSAAIDAAFISAFHTYVQRDLKFDQLPFRLGVWDAKDFHWDWTHKMSGLRFAASSRSGIPNVMPDLASAMKFDPKLQVMLIGGLYDLSTPFYTAIYEMEHLPIPRSLRKNIHYAFFPAGHMMYVHVPSLKQLHDDVASFIDATDNQGSK